MVILLLVPFFGWRTHSHIFKDDPIGRAAESFFPAMSSLSDTTQSKFEYRKITSLIAKDYEGYYLKLTFGSRKDYNEFLEKTETDYSDMTETQRRSSYFIIDNVRFIVGDYSFRAIDMDPFAPVNEDFVGLIAHCDQTKTLVFLYIWSAWATIEDISDGLGPHGYMFFYEDSWGAE